MDAPVNEIFDLSMTDLKGQTHQLSEYRGNVLLIVNVASACGFTPQMRSLEELYREHANEGLTVLAFPSNDFNQEPLEGKKLEEHLCAKFDVTFPVFEVSSVRGKGKNPLFATLTNASRGVLGREVLWNFEKFLVARDGRLIARWRSFNSPDGKAIDRAVKAALAEAPAAP